MKREPPGFVLVAVLAGLLLVAAISFALLFLTTLDTLAARSAQQAVMAEAQLQGALDLALALLVSSASAGETIEAALGPGQTPTSLLGPWPEHGLAAQVEVSQLPDDEGGGGAVVRLEARLDPPSARSPAQLVARLGAAPVVLWRP